MDPAEGLEIDRLATGDGSGLDSVLALMRLVQPHLQRSRELLEWQYFRTPAGAGSVYVLHSDGVLAAVYCAARQQIRVGDRAYPGWMVQDVMTHPDYRGRGYLHRLADVCLSDLRDAAGIGYTFPNEQSQRSFRRTGWTELCQVPFRAKAVGRSPARSSNEIASREVAVFAEAATRVWRDSGLAVGVDRSSSFLNWRYSKPGQRYSRFMLDGDGGVLILKLFDDGTSRTVHICDLFVDARSRELVPGAVRFAEAFAAANGAELLTAWLGRDHPYATQFDHAGVCLAESASRFVFVACPDEVAAECGDARSWHLSQGDSDVY